MSDPHRRFWSRQRFAASALLCAAWLQACSKQVVYPGEEKATPAPDASVTGANDPPAGPLQPVDEEVLAQERAYHEPAATKEQREAILRTIGSLLSPHAVPALRRIFDREMRMDLKLAVVDVVADHEDAGSVAQRYDLLSHATEAKQPPAVRLAAMAAIEDVEDPRVPALIRNLTHDPNPMVRSDSGRILQELQEMRTLKK